MAGFDFDELEALDGVERPSPADIETIEDVAEDAVVALDKLCADIGFWEDLITHREYVEGFDIRAVDHVDEITQRDIDAQYDLTKRRIEQILKRYDVNNDGKVRRGEFIRGIKSQGFMLSELACTRLIAAMDVEKWGFLSEEKVTLVLQRLKLAELFSEPVRALERKMAAILPTAFKPTLYSNAPSPSHADTKVSPHEELEYCSTLNVTDYSIEGVASEWPITDLKGYFFGRRRNQEMIHGGVRWVHMQGLDKIMLLRLAAKHRLHPVAVEDALEMCHQPAKADKYYNQFFLAINALQLDERTKRKAEKDDVPPRVFIHCSYICMFQQFVTTAETDNPTDRGEGHPNNKNRDDMLISIHQEQVFGHAPRGKPDHTTTPRKESSRRLKRAPSFSEHANTRGADIFQEVFDQIERSSRVRDNDSDFLMYSILDKCVDELQPIVAAYDARLSFFQDRMREMKTSFPDAYLDEISAVKMELMDLMRTMRPLNVAIKHIIDDPIVCSGFPMYLEDVQDHLDQVTEDVKALIELCTCLAQDYNMFGDQKMNSTLYVLTIVTTIFFPAQFVAGMYGMNFVQKDGTPAIPELEWKNGYAYFWALVVGISSLMVLLFKCMKFL